MTTSPWTPRPTSSPTPLGCLRMAVSDYLAAMEDDGVTITDDMLAAADAAVDSLVNDLVDLSA